MNKKMVFKCPECGHDVLNEVATENADITPIKGITIEGEIVEAEYGNVETFFGDTVHYRCANPQCNLLIPERSIKELAESGYMVEIDNREW